MNILIDSLNCNPNTGSNGESGFGFVMQALQNHTVHLCTHRELFRSGPNILCENASMPLHVHEIAPGLFRKFGRQTDYLTQIYFKARTVLRKTDVDIIHTVEPNQYRLCRPLAFLNAPFVLGPLNGGNAYPPESFLSDISRIRGTAFDPVRASRNLKERTAHAVNHQLVHGNVAQLCTDLAFAKATRIVIGTENCLSVIPGKYHIKCRKVPCFGIDTQRFCPKPTADPMPPSVLYVGRITPFKGLDLLIRAVARMNMRDTILDIVGTSSGERSDEEFEKYCRELAAELKISECVRFHGVMPRDVLPSLYQRASVFCLPSLWEPLGMVFLEAMSCGVPVIGLDAGGPREIIDDTFGVRLRTISATQCIGELSSVLKNLLTDRQLSLRMGNQGRNRVLEQYTWSRVGNQMEQVYQEVL